MQLLTTFGDTRRSRRRQAFLGTARVAAIGLALVVGAGASYQIGVAKSRIEVARLEADISALQELNRLLSERAANAEQRAEAAIMRQARLQQRYDVDVPRGDTRALIDLLHQRLKEGLPPERIAFLLREAQVARKCDPQTEVKRLPVHTPASTVAGINAAFAGNKITVTAEGEATRRPDGRTEAAFDPARPVTLRFLRIGRDVTRAQGQLPLSHSLVLGDKEYLFAIKPADKAPGQIEIVVQACNYP